MKRRKLVSKFLSRPTHDRVRRSITEALEERRLFAVGLVSVGFDGSPANGDSGEASVDSSGRYVAFSSFATNLVAGDTNAHRDIFLRDRQTGTTTLISKNPSTGALGDNDSAQPVINADGTYVAFVSRASNLTSVSDTLGNNDIFRYNIQTGALEIVSVKSGTGGTSSTAAVLGGGSSSEPTISKDGNIISFTSFAGNLLDQGTDGNRANDVFVRNLGPSAAFGIQSNRTVLVSVNTGGVASGSALSFDSWISSDGRYIAFRSDASDLVAGDSATGFRDTFVRDLQSGTTSIISVNPSGAPGNAASDSNSISGDGRFVTFQSAATDLVSNDGNNNTDVFLRDTTTGKTTLLSINRFGTNSAGGFSEFPALSQNGDYASFSSTASDIVTGDSNGREDVFLRDLVRGPLTLLSVNTANAPANGRSYDPFISSTGGFTVFTSDASDMAANDSNNKADIFIATAPDPAVDTAPPTAVVAGSDSVSPGATAVTFTVNLADNIGLNTVSVGNLEVVKSGGGPTLTATLVSVVGTGTTAVATYSVGFPSGVDTVDTGTYNVTTTANAIKDAAGNAIASGTNIGSFVLSIGDPNGPDLTIASPGKIPGAVIGGKVGKFKFKTINRGPGLVNGSVNFTVYLSSDATVDAGDTAVATVAKKLKLKVNKGKAVNVKFTYPTSIGDGNYFLVARADSTNSISESNEGNNTGASLTTVLVQAPFVDLEAVSVNKPKSSSASVANSTTMVIKNNGNIPFKGTPTIAVVAVPEATQITDASPSAGTVTPKLTIAPGKTKVVKLSFALPTGLTGNQQLGVEVDPTNAIAESNEANNTALSTVFAPA